MNLETKITIYKFTPQVFTLTQNKHIKAQKKRNDFNRIKDHIQSFNSL